MSIEAFTNFGIFVALFIGYLLITGLIGCIQRGMEIDGDRFFSSVGVWSIFVCVCSHGFMEIVEVTE